MTSRRADAQSSRQSWRPDVVARRVGVGVGVGATEQRSSRAASVPLSTTSQQTHRRTDERLALRQQQVLKSSKNQPKSSQVQVANVMSQPEASRLIAKRVSSASSGHQIMESKASNGARALLSRLSSLIGYRRRKSVRWLALAVLWLLAGSEQCGAQCPMNTMTSFERIGGVLVKDSHLTLLYSAPNATGSGSAGGVGLRDQQQQSGAGAARGPGIPITAECNNRCRRSSRCRAFLVDYARHVCYSVEQSASALAVSLGAGNLLSPARIQLVPTHERTAYFEKHCFSLAGLDCERAWIFERVPNFLLQGHDDRVIEDVATRIRCQELCANEREFKCRSGEYDYVSMQCRLSALDRHTKPRLFRPGGPSVDYFENQCVSLGQQCDAFERFDNMDLGRAEIVRSANSSEQCQQFCTQTIKAFVCRSFTWSALSGKCYLNSANTLTVGGPDRLLSAPGLTYFQRNECFDLQLDCDHTAMTLSLRTSEPFRGRMYVRDEPSACESVGRSALSSSLMIPLQSHARCATRELVNRFSSVVVVQQHPTIQRKSDRYVKLVCDFQTSNKTVTSSYNVVANPWTSTALINATSFAPKIRLRITDRFESDVVGAKLGDELFLNIEAEGESVYDMAARSVVAKSGGAEAESIVLIDKDGCPTDPRIFPAMKKLSRRKIRGKFDAFKFSTDVVVRFQVDVQFCLNQCPASACEPSAPALLALAAGDLVSGLDTYSAGSFGGSASLAPTTAGPAHAADAAADSTPSAGGLNTAPPLPFGGARMPPTDGSATSSGPLAGSAAPAYAAGAVHQQPRPLAALEHPSYAETFTVAPGAEAALATRTHHNHQYPSAPANQPANASALGQGAMLSNSYVSGQSVGGAAGAAASDPQVFEARMSPHSAALLDGSARRLDAVRRRRSAQPMPAVPTHVPLQGEIIIRDRDEPPAPAASAHKPRTPTDRPQKHRHRNGRKEHSGPSYDINGQTDQTDFLSSGADDAQRDNGALLCTNRHSLVLASLAFCTIQFLTIALCLITWLNRNRDASKLRIQRPIDERLY